MRTRIALTLAMAFALVALAGPAPTMAAGKATPYRTFLNQRTTFLAAIGGHNDALTCDVDPACDDDLQAAANDAAQIAGHYTAELAWTKAHPAMSCYKVLWTAARAQASYGVASYAALGRWAAASGVDDADWSTYESQGDLFDNASDDVLNAYDEVTC